MINAIIQFFRLFLRGALVLLIICSPVYPIVLLAFALEHHLYWIIAAMGVAFVTLIGWATPQISIRR